MSEFAKLPGADVSPDVEPTGGLCFDAAGNLYVAYPRIKDVLVLDSKGQAMQAVPVRQSDERIVFWRTLPRSALRHSLRPGRADETESGCQGPRSAAGSVTGIEILESRWVTRLCKARQTANWV